ncbi:MAG: hypothetical protein ACYS83_11440 [Planctomycetota bacterium]
MFGLDAFADRAYNAPVGLCDPTSFALTLQFPQGKDFRRGIEKVNDGRCSSAVDIYIGQKSVVQIHVAVKGR